MVFCPLNILCAFVKDQLLYLCGSISGLSILLRGSVCLFFGQYLLVRFYSKTGGQATSGAWLCASPVLQQLLWVFRFPCQVRVSFSVFTKQLARIEVRPLAGAGGRGCSLKYALPVREHQTLVKCERQWMWKTKPKTSILWREEKEERADHAGRIRSWKDIINMISEIKDIASFKNKMLFYKVTENKRALEIKKYYNRYEHFDRLKNKLKKNLPERERCGKLER